MISALFLITLLLLSLLSWIGNVYDWGLQSLYSAEGLRFLVSNALPNLRQAPLTETLLATICLGVLTESGLPTILTRIVRRRRHARPTLKQQRALQLTFLLLLLLLAILAALTLIPPYILLSAFGTFADSALAAGLPVLLLLLLASIGIVYGGLSGQFLSFADVLRACAHWPTRLASQYATMLLAAELIACIAYVCPSVQHHPLLWLLLQIFLYALPFLHYFLIQTRHSTPTPTQD